MKKPLEMFFTAFAVITLGLALLGGPLWSLRENSDTNGLLGMIGVVGIYSFLFNFNFNKKLSLFKVIMISVSVAAFIVYLDQARGFEPGLYPTTLFFGSITLFLGVAMVIGKDVFYSIAFSVVLGSLLWRILLIMGPWWLWYIDKYLVYIVPGYFTIVMSLSFVRFKKGLASHIAQTA